MARKSSRSDRAAAAGVPPIPVKARATKLTLTLDPETVCRLKILATMRGVHPRDLVTAAVAELVAGLVVYERPRDTPSAPVPCPSPGGPERPQDAPGQARLWSSG